LHDVYTSRDYIRVDPNVRRALHSSRPFEWTWEDYGDEHGPRSTEVMRVLADFTLLRGFFVSVHSVGGYEAAVALSGADVELAPEAQPRLDLMSLCAFERVRQLRSGKQESSAPSIAHRRSPSRSTTDCSMSKTAASRHR
jgi:Autoinducer binding domain